VRAKLGLKPLQIDGAKNADGSLVVTKKQEDVHAPPVNLTAVKKAAEIKDKIEARKEKRSIDKKLKLVLTFACLLVFCVSLKFFSRRRKVKLLGVAAVEEEESTEAWAERTRREARQKAAERVSFFLRLSHYRPLILLHILTIITRRKRALPFQR
jgi:hypothetical protein